MSSAPDMPDDDDVLAAEYALGLLDGESLSQARARAATEPGFAAAAQAWEAWLAEMADGIAPVRPDPATWDRIAAAIRSRRLPAPVVPIGRSRRTKVFAGSIALAASVALALGVWTTRRPPPAPVPAATIGPPLIATIAPRGAASFATARYDPADRTLVVVPAALPPLRQGSHELWVIPADGRPRSLGLLASGPALRIAFADDFAGAFARGCTLAISVEAEGGSRTGQPGGAVVASGKLG